MEVRIRIDGLGFRAGEDDRKGKLSIYAFCALYTGTKEELETSNR